MNPSTYSPAAHAATPDLAALAVEVKRLGSELGFDKVGISGIDLADDERYLERWLALGRHGEMAYMAKHGSKRSHPEQLVPGTLRVIAARLPYWPPQGANARHVLADPSLGYVARYALGRDYHKTFRGRLKRFAAAIEQRIGAFQHRVFVDSGPVLEKALARNAGLGWVGKHTNLLDRSGSWFLLGELLTDLPLPIDAPVTEHCGTCRACIDVCPTGAIVGPYELDARRCISYVTIEQKGSIPHELRPLLGNRVFGCDDCQLFCPWNKFASAARIADFTPRHNLEASALVTLFAWSQDEWLAKTEGSALRRAGYEGWLRNVAVALGNAPSKPEVIAALEARSNDASELVREHVAWALARHREPPRADETASTARAAPSGG